MLALVELRDTGMQCQQVHSSVALDGLDWTERSGSTACMRQLIDTGDAGLELAEEIDAGSLTIRIPHQTLNMKPRRIGVDKN